jgi:hypothetical protein
MKILFLALLVTGSWSASAAESSRAGSCTQDQHVQWAETCLFLMDLWRPGTRDPFILLQDGRFQRDQDLVAGFSSACKDLVENPGKIEDDKWKRLPDLLDRVGQCDWSGHEEWLHGCMAAVDRLKRPGTRRRDLLEHFLAEDTSNSPATYSSRRCPPLKVGIWFTDTSGTEAEEDVIQDIFSYLAYRASARSQWRTDD